MSLLGAFLVSRGVVTAEQVLAALDRQRAQRPALGQIAMRRGFIDARQLLDILDHQRDGGAKAGMFGEVAERLGYMTRDQVRAACDEQATHGPRLGELLVSMGVIEPLQLQRELADFDRKKR